ncbi:MAG: hypothetical protein LBS32_07605 [Clostridiales Family XIII bacterium]|nr:hypothetical protein [Clostridiales Family XIII bacterium]
MGMEWRLGVDMHEGDDIMDGITFEQVLTMAECNEPEIDEGAMTRCFGRLMEQRAEDACFVMERNLAAMTAMARRLRGG